MHDIPDFFSCILEASIDELRNKLGKKFDTRLKDSYDQICLHLSCFTGNYEITELLIKYDGDVNAKDINGVSPLLKACASKHLKIVQLLLDNKADINCCDNFLLRPLHVCASNNALEIMNDLILPKVKCINIVDKEGRSAVHHAVINGHDEMLQLLIKNEASLVVQDTNGCRPLHWAVAKGHTNILDILLEHKTNINCRDKKGYIPLHVAASCGHLDIVIKLIEKHAELDCLTNDNNTAIHLACANCHLTIVDEIMKALNSDHLFVEYIKRSDMPDEGKSSLLENLKDAEKLHLMMSNRLTKMLNTENSQRMTPLHILSQQNTNFPERVASCVEYLIDSGANPNIQAEDGKTPLMLATIVNQLSVVKQLVLAGADVNIQDEDGNTALHLASRYDYENIVKYLLDHKADALILREDGQYPIHVAAFYGNSRCMQKLLDPVIRKMHINKVPSDVNGRNLVHCAVIGGSLKCLENLLRLGCDFKQEDNSKNTPLHLAVKKNNFSMARIFIKLKLDVDSVDEYNCTPLHYAAMKNTDGNIIKLLMENGADVVAKVHLSDPSRFLDPNLNNDNSITEYKLVFPIHFAAAYGNVTGFKMIFEEMVQEARLDCLYGPRDSLTFDSQSAMDPELLSVINVAAYNDQFDVLTHCSRQFHKEIVSVTDKNGRTPLLLAAYQGHTSVVKLLNSLGAKTMAPDRDYLWNAIHYAASQGHVEVLNELLHYPKEQRHRLVNSTDEHKRTPLMLAAQNGHLSICDRLLIDYKASVNLEDIYGRTALHRAAANGHIDCVELMLSYKANVSIADFRHRTSIHMAAAAGHLKILIKLIESYIGSKPQPGDYISGIVKPIWFDVDSYTPLHFAAYKGHIECFKYLFDLVGDMKEMEAPLSLLICAIQSKCEETLELVIKLTQGSLINVADNCGWTPVFYACQTDNYQALSILLTYNPDLSARDEDGLTPILLAIRENAINCVKLLLPSNFAQVSLNTVPLFQSLTVQICNDTDSKYNRNILHWVAMGRNENLGVTILNRLPDNYNFLVNAKDNQDQTPAHLAVKFGFPIFLEKLIAKQADLFIYNRFSQLPIAASDDDHISQCISICINAMFSDDSKFNKFKPKYEISDAPPQTFISNTVTLGFNQSESSESEFY